MNDWELARKSTNALWKLVEEGMLDPKDILNECLQRMSEDEVAEMCHECGYLD